MTETYYHFLPSLRQGLAASIQAIPGEEEKRVAIPIYLHAERRKKSTGEWEKTENTENTDDAFKPIERVVNLYGPGDVATFDTRMIVRMDPQPNSGNFEPNYFPAIEFADPDFPWRFSPEPVKAGGSSAPDHIIALTPWITLIALVAEDRGDDIRKEFETLPRGRNQRPAIRVLSQQHLPNLHHAWRWAHVQATTGTENLIAERLARLPAAEQDALGDEEKRDMVAAEIGTLFLNRPELVVSRLLCPRRLKPKTLYQAFIVPTYKLGWAVALDTPEAHGKIENCNAIDLAWDNESGAPIDLPYFHQWEFHTSARGDFESLVRLLKPQALTGLGLRDIDCERPGFGLTIRDLEADDEQSHLLAMEGALQSLDTKYEYTRWGKDKNGPRIEEQEDPPIPDPEPFQIQLADDLLNKANVQPQVTLPPGFGNGVLDSFSFNVLRDGKSVQISWRTLNVTTGILDYGSEDEAGGYAYSYHAISDTSKTHHTVKIQLVPETIYHFRLRIQNSGEIVTDDAQICISLPAVVPPIYGRWHAARQRVVADQNHNGWIDELNLDPRHRAAAGLGAEVIRKQQEALMASAWDQIGAIEAANDVLRRAKFGREGSVFLHNRLHDLALEDFLRLTGPVQKRITRDNGDGRRKTIQTELTNETQLLKATLSPAFRRLARPRGPIHHNHPSSDPSPSPEDVNVTRQIVQAGKLLDIELLDHLVIADQGYVSLKERGLGFD